MGRRDEDVKPPVTRRRIAAGILVAVGIIVPLLVTTYARDEPRLAGWPFFYWYQMLLIPLTACLTAIAYLLMRQDDRRRRARQRTEGGTDTDDTDEGADS